MANVLIVEDDPVIANLHQRILTRLGHKITGIVKSEQEILPHLSNSHIILLDIALDGPTTGIPICRHLKETHPQVKIIFVSAYPQTSFLQELEGIKFDGYLDKMDFREKIESTINAAKVHQ